MQVMCLMLACMETYFQKHKYVCLQHDVTIENYVLMKARLERFEVNKKIFEFKLEKEKPVDLHVFNDLLKSWENWVYVPY